MLGSANALKKYVERVYVVLPKPMKAALIDLAIRDGRNVSELIRSWIGERLAEDRRQKLAHR
jgi:hypothetical protein